MYNGIGLPTARGSGTNGYVQRNWAHVPPKRERVEYKTEDEARRFEQQLSKGPNLEILQHARKRQIELKCLEMRDLMEEQNYPEEEIEQKVSKFRKMLLEKDVALEKVVLEKDEFGRPICKETHEIAFAQTEKNLKFKEALGLPVDYVDGSSLSKIGKDQEEGGAIEKPAVYAFTDEIDDIEADMPPQVVPPQQTSTYRQSESEQEQIGKQKDEKRRKDKKKKSKHNSHSRSKSPHRSSSEDSASRRQRSRQRHESNESRDKNEHQRTSRRESGSNNEKRGKVVEKRDHSAGRHHKRHNRSDD